MSSLRSTRENAFKIKLWKEIFRLWFSYPYRFVCIRTPIEVCRNLFSKFLTKNTGNEWQNIWLKQRWQISLYFFLILDWQLTMEQILHWYSSWILLPVYVQIMVLVIMIQQLQSLLTINLHHATAQIYIKVSSRKMNNTHQLQIVSFLD